MSKEYSFFLGVGPGWHFSSAHALRAFLESKEQHGVEPHVSFLIDNATRFKTNIQTNVYADTSVQRYLVGKEKHETRIVAILDPVKAVEYKLKYSKKEIDSSYTV